MPVELSRPATPTSSKKSGEVESIRIEVADGGYVASCMRREASGMNGPTSYGGPSKSTVVGTLADLHAYIDEELGGGEPAEEPAAEEAPAEEPDTE